MAWINKIEIDLRWHGNHGFCSHAINAQRSFSELTDHTHCEVWPMEAFVVYLENFTHKVTGLQNNNFLLHIYMTECIMLSVDISINEDRHTLELFLDCMPGLVSPFLNI